MHQCVRYNCSESLHHAPFKASLPFFGLVCQQLQPANLAALCWCGDHVGALDRQVTGEVHVCFLIGPHFKDEELGNILEHQGS